MRDNAYALTARFVNEGRVYQARGYNSPAGRIIVTGIKVHFQQMGRDGFRHNRTRNVFRGMDNEAVTPIVSAAIHNLQKARAAAFDRGVEL